MKRILMVLVGLSIIINTFVLVRAKTEEDKIVIGIKDASKELLEQLTENGVSYNNSTKIGIVEVKNNLNSIETSTVLAVITLADGIIEQSLLWHFDENGSVLPVKLEKQSGTKDWYGQYTAVYTDSNTAFVGTTRSVYTLYVQTEGAFQYIRPISAGFNYHYNTGYSGTFNGTYAYKAYGPLYSYPSYSLLENWYEHIITISKNSAAQNVTYTNTNPLPYGRCIGLATSGISIDVWGLFYGTANGVYFEWYTNALVYED